VRNGRKNVTDEDRSDEMPEIEGEASMDGEAVAVDVAVASEAADLEADVAEAPDVPDVEEAPPEKKKKKKKNRSASQVDGETLPDREAVVLPSGTTLEPPGPKDRRKNGKLTTKYYEKQLAILQEELAKLQAWIKREGLKVVVIFEGRDAAGKGGVIKRIAERLNPRIVRIEALGTPTEREKTQWYFQRYTAVLPGAGEMVLFDRSWYNRAGVERVMGFCTDEEYWEFLRSCPEFERMLIRSGITVIKFWFSVSQEEQERRFQGRMKDPKKRWKLSDMDLKSRMMWEEYSKAKDEMFRYTDIKQAPWFVVPADDKKAARLNCITHLLMQIPYETVVREEIELEPRPDLDASYVRPPITDQTFVTHVY
jgi:polyphosphate kinase 2